MLYLLDANTLIDAARDYYPISRVPEFWDWLEYHGTADAIKIPIEIFEEITGSEDELSEWLQTDAVRTALVLNEDVQPALVEHVVTIGYAPDLTDDDLIRVGRDPFLIAYGLASPRDRCVVSTEASKPSARRANRKVPDVCRGFAIDCCHTFELVRRLDFTTQWRRPIGGS